MIPLQEAQCAIAVAQHGSFRRAAAAVYLSQPAVSTYIDRLERRLAIRVFDRSRSGTTVTADGRQIIPHLEALIEMHAHVESECRRIGSDTAPKLSIASQRIGLVSLLPPALRVLRGIVDNLTVEVQHAADQPLHDLVASGAVDLGVGYRRSGIDSADDTLEEVAIETTPSVVFMTADHRLANNTAIVAADLAGETLITVHSPLGAAGTASWVRDVPDISWVRADDTQVVLSMVEQRVGVAVSIAAAAVLGPASLVAVPVFEGGWYDLTMMRRRDVELSAPAQILWDLMVPPARAAAA